MKKPQASRFGVFFRPGFLVVLPLLEAEQVGRFWACAVVLVRAWRCGGLAGAAKEGVRPLGEVLTALCDVLASASRAKKTAAFLGLRMGAERVVIRTA